MRNAISGDALDQIFRSAWTYQGWTDTPIEEAIVRNLYDLLKWGPTSANSSPNRFVWVRSAAGKAKLAALASEKNRPKILQAPLTVIIGNDLDFANQLPTLMPHNAEAMQKVGAAVMLEDESLGTTLEPAVRELLGDAEQLKKMGEAARKVGVPDADERIARHLLELVV